MLSAKYLVFFYLSAIVADLGNAYCPCHIYLNEKGYEKADCWGKNLTTIPNCIPNTTQWLDFGNNNLRYTPGQFQKFGNLVVLDMYNNMSLVMRKLAFCICENKDADQLRGDREADQRLCFRYTDSIIPLLPKYEISSL